MAKKDYVNHSYKQPDHPVFKQKRHNMVIDNQSGSNRKVETESGTIRFEDGVAVLPNDDRARDIVDELKETEALHPNQYSLIEDKPTVNADSIHRYTFGYNRRFSENWDRIFGNRKEPENREVKNEQSRTGTAERSSPELRTEA